jgi:hypothetical protein
VQQVGGSFGAAVVAMILQLQVAHHPAGPAGLAAAFGVTFWWSLAFTVLAAGAAPALEAGEDLIAASLPIAM